MLKIKILLVAAFVTTFIFACANNSNINSNVNRSNSAMNAPNTNAVSQTSNAASQNSAVTTDAGDELAGGGKIYQEMCVKCHKENGTGGEVTIDGKKLKARNLTTERMKKDPDSEYVDAIANGIIDEGMPAYKDKLSAAEIQSVIKYVRATFQK